MRRLLGVALDGRGGLVDRLQRAGAGTLQAINKTAAAVKRYAKKSPHANATENTFRDKIPSLEREEDGK